MRASQSRSGGDSGCSSPRAVRSRAAFSSAGIRCGILVGTQRAADDQGERHETHAGHVGAMIEPRQPGARRHRDPELLPETLARELELLDRGAEHVLDDHEPCVRRDDQALRRDQAVRDLAGVLVHQRDGRHQLSNQAQRRIDVELQIALAGGPQHVREPRAFDVVGDNRQAGRGNLDAVDAADPGVVGVAEVREPRRALAQRELERGHRGERRADAQDLEQLAGRTVGRDDAVTETVAEQRRFRPLRGKRHCVHGRNRPVSG